MINRRFFQVVFDLDFDSLSQKEKQKFYGKADSLLHQYATPLYVKLNSFYLRQNKFHFGDYRGIQIRLTRNPEPVHGTIQDNGNRGPFPGRFLLSNAVINVDEFISTPFDLDTIGERIVGIYDEGLSLVRGKYGIPSDFLEAFIDDFQKGGYCFTLEHKKISFPEHKLMTRVVSEFTPVQARYYLAVRRMRSKKEDRVLIGTIERSTAIGMFHEQTFDGTHFHIENWFQKPSWPISYARNVVPLDEFDI